MVNYILTNHRQLSRLFSEISDTQVFVISTLDLLALIETFKYYNKDDITINLQFSYVKKCVIAYHYATYKRHYKTGETLINDIAKRKKIYLHSYY